VENPALGPVAPGRRRLRPRVVCSIGSCDPTAGAGLFTDARVYSTLGVAATFVVAAVTAQNSMSVAAVYPLPPGAIVAQLRSVWAQVRPDAVRIGLVPSAAGIDAIARFFASMRRPPPIALDPVLSASSGKRFAGAREVAALRRLMGRATIVTPNAEEAASLAGLAKRDAAHPARSAVRLARLGCAVLVTGGDLADSSCIDVFVRAGGVRPTQLRSARLAPDMRGTGCVLTAALAAHLALGQSLVRAVREARAYVRKEIKRARPLGRGRPQLAWRQPR